jgi:membrane fusion protein, multidrug efflux system
MNPPEVRLTCARDRRSRKWAVDLPANSGHPLAWTIVTALLLILSGSCQQASDHTLGSASAQTAAPAPPATEVVTVVSQPLNITVRLPGELLPYEAVTIYPKVTGFVEWIGVDRGSSVKAGQLIVRLVAPELVAQRAEAQAKVEGAEGQRAAAEAKLAADESAYQKLEAASRTPGVVAGNDLVVAEKSAEADGARMRAAQQAVLAAKSSLRSVAEMERYLEIKAPFDGVITERNVHPGTLVGPAGGAAVPIGRIEKMSRLRLVVAVPEIYVGGIPQRTRVSFSVPAYPGKTFSGPVARIAHSVDAKTRTMPVELDVMNPVRQLDPGMFPEVLWPVRRPKPTLFVPPSAVVRTTERVFVIRIRDRRVEWVDVTTGAVAGKLIEVFGNLNQGDTVALRGTDELRPGALVSQPAASK